MIESIAVLFGSQSVVTDRRESGDGNTPDFSAGHAGDVHIECEARRHFTLCHAARQQFGNRGGKVKKLLSLVLRTMHAQRDGN